MRFNDLTSKSEPLAGSSEPMRENPFHEFPEVAMALSLLKEINSEGRQAILESPEPMITSLEKTQPVHRLAMNAVAILLVRKHEAIAVTSPSRINSRDSGSTSDADVQFLVMQEADEVDRSKADISPEKSRPSLDLPPIWKENPNAQYTIVSTRKSAWQAVSENPWCQRWKPSTLADHAATLQDYFAEYQAIKRDVMKESEVEALTPELKQQVSEHRIVMFDCFTRYILSTCHPKMRSRTKHPVSKKYFHCLFSITTSGLKIALSTVDIAVSRPTRIRDLPLCDAILGSEDIFNFLEHYLRNQQSDLTSDFRFTALRRAFSDLNDFRNSGEADISKCPSLYTKETIVEFHYLLLTVLTGYKAGLAALTNAPQDELAGGQYDDYNVAWIFTFLLWRIAHSSILRHHLTFLHTAGLLSLGGAGCSMGDVGLLKDDVSRDDEEIEVADEGIESTNQEMLAMQLHAKLTEECQNPDMGLAFLRWIHLLVCHITALETLSLFLQHKILDDTKVRIDIVVLRPTALESDLEIPWKPVIQCALQSQSPLLYPQFDTIVCTLADLIKQGKEKSEGFTLFEHFTEEVMTVTGVVHCEAALACLLKYPAAIPTKGTKLRFDSSRYEIVMSKLCCPACWQLLAFIDPLGARFGVRGHHHEAFPMRLPPWIPETQARAMVDLFRQRLCHEISTMMERQSQGDHSLSTSSSIVSFSTVTGGEHTTGPARQALQSLNFKHLIALPSLKFPLWGT